MTPVVHLTIPFRVQTFTNALLGYPWNSSSSQPRPTCLVLHEVGTPIRPTPTRPPTPIPYPPRARFPHRILLCVRDTIVVPLLVLPDLLQFSFLGDADPRMGIPQRMKAVSNWNGWGLSTSWIGMTATKGYVHEGPMECCCAGYVALRFGSSLPLHPRLFSPYSLEQT